MDEKIVEQPEPGVSPSRVFARYLIYLAYAGSLSKRDLHLHLYVEPRVRYLIKNYNKLKLEFDEDVLIEYLWDLISGREKVAGLAERLRAVEMLLAKAGSKELKYYIPMVTEIIAMVERKLSEMGLLDARLENVFSRMYEALSRDRVRVQEVLTYLSRAVSLLGKGEVESGKIERVKEVVSGVEGMVKRVDSRVVVEVLKVVKDYNDKGVFPTVRMVVSDLLKKGVIPDPRSGYNAIKSAAGKKYIEIVEGRLRLTESGAKKLKNE